jgi:putative flippase GtrA
METLPPTEILTPPTASPTPDRLQRLVKQFSKFVIVGGVNTGIDFAVLNILMFVTGIAAGNPLLFFLNCISFSVAVVNSYYMNKRWTFREAAAGLTDKNAGIQFSQFFVVSIIGILINSTVLTAITTLLPAPFDLGPQMWANVGKLIATGLSLVWNFVGYKLFVFRA